MSTFGPVECFILAFIILLFTCSTSAWPTSDINYKFDNIITDERDGSIFASLDGDIFKYSGQLKPVRNTTKSSAISNTRQHDTKALQMISIGGNQLVLMTCWQRTNLTLTCGLFDTNSLQWAPLPWSNLTFRVEPGEHIQVTPVQQQVTERSRQKLPDDLLISSSRTIATDRDQVRAANSSTPSNLPAIARFKIIKQKLELISELPYRSELGGLKFFYDYIYAFRYDGHVYYILNDIRKSTEDLQSAKYSTRLARICEDDLSLNSYTEVSLTCNGQSDFDARVAHLNSSTLHIIFENRPSDEKKSAGVSHLCSYSMKLAQDIFDKVVSDCHRGKYFRLDKSSETDFAPLCQLNPSTDWCTSRLNPYIDGTSSEFYLKEDTYLELPGLSNANFLLAQPKDDPQKIVYFVGTQSGQLTKFDSSEDPYFSIDLYEKRVENYPPSGMKLSSVFSNETIASRRGTKYIFGSGFITALTQHGQIHQLAVDSCQYYTSCHSCKTVQDPLGCVWCGDTCSTSNSCADSKRSADCPPIIYDFSPRSGPTTGSTKLIIVGDNFGTTKGSLSVFIGSHYCPVDRVSSNNNKIECLTESVDNATSTLVGAVINVTVSDTTYIDVKGSTTSKVPFEYKRVAIYGVHPNQVSSAGGADVSVYGENLDTGRDRAVYFGATKCEISAIQSSRLSCKIHPLNTTSISRYDYGNDDKIVEQPLRVFVDGARQTTANKSSWPPDVLALNASTALRFSAGPAVTTTALPSQDEAPQEWSYPLSLTTLKVILLFLVPLILIIIIYLHRREGISWVKDQLYPSNHRTKDSPNGATVTYRNPQSFTFIGNSQPNNRATDSLSGLIKLNDSIISSDYFSRAETAQFAQDKPLMNNFLDEEMMSILAQEKILIDRNRLTLGHVLGSGQFGRVYKGFLKMDDTGEHTAVAVKTLHNRCHWDDTTDNRAFLDEGLMMKDFDHENVLALIGVTFDANGLPMVITPFMLYSDLRTYISSEASSPTVKELIEFGIQIAKGMAYLSNLKFVHRDLAARNCMLDENLVAKVADFGLSRDIYERDYYSSDNRNAKLPVKWMAIESLEKCVYSTKTDVWSYGVLLWELMTRGVVPYPDVDNFDLFTYLKEGRRMMRPRYCPLSLYKIMKACWSADPSERPSFDELVTSVSNVITQLQEAKDDGGQQKVSRNETYCDLIK